MNAPDSAFFSREYNARAAVPDHAQYLERWAESSARARGTMTCYLDRRYGDMPGETMDIFPARKGDGSCMMFIHGGYWRSLEPASRIVFSVLAITVQVLLLLRRAPRREGGATRSFS